MSRRRAAAAVTACVQSSGAPAFLRTNGIDAVVNLGSYEGGGAAEGDPLGLVGWFRPQGYVSSTPHNLIGRANGVSSSPNISINGTPYPDRVWAANFPAHDGAVVKAVQDYGNAVPSPADDTWLHVVFAYDGANGSACRLYVNGSLVGLGGGYLTATEAYRAAEMLIGYDYNSFKRLDARGLGIMPAVAPTAGDAAALYALGVEGEPLATIVARDPAARVYSVVTTDTAGDGGTIADANGGADAILTGPVEIIEL